MVVVHIDQDFSRRLAAGEPTRVQVLLDGRKSNSAQLVNGYIDAIVRQFSEDFRGGAAARSVSAVVDRTWYNPNRDYQWVLKEGWRVKCRSSTLADPPDDHLSLTRAPRSMWLEHSARRALATDFPPGIRS
jgi:hypothetical protein